MPLDMLATSEIYPYDTHIRKHYPYVYQCRNCGRNYPSKKRQAECKFCTNPGLKLIMGGNRYIYFCENCDRRIESDEPKMACPDCGSRIMTLYRWDMLDKQEKRRIRFARLLKSFSNTMPNIEIKRPAKKPKASPLIPQKEEPAKGEELPSDQMK